MSLAGTRWCRSARRDLFSGNCLCFIYPNNNKAPPAFRWIPPSSQRQRQAPGGVLLALTSPRAAPGPGGRSPAAAGRPPVTRRGRSPRKATPRQLAPAEQNIARWSRQHRDPPVRYPTSCRYPLPPPRGTPSPAPRPPRAVKPALQAGRPRTWHARACPPAPPPPRLPPPPASDLARPGLPPAPPPPPRLPPRPAPVRTRRQMGRGSRRPGAAMPASPSSAASAQQRLPPPARCRHRQRK